MKTNLLTDTQVKNATSKGKAIHKYADGAGLYLWANADGSKYWRYRYWFAKKEKALSLGVYPKVGLSEARKRRDELIKQLGEGIDPGVKRKADKASAILNSQLTVKAVGEQWFESQVHIWSASHTTDVRRRLDKDIYAHLGTWLITDLTAPVILEAVRKVEARGASDLSHRVMGMIGQILRWAVANGYDTRDFTVDLRGALKAHIKGNQPAVEQKELPQLLYDITQYDKPPYNCDRQILLALQLLMLTFVRTSELINAPWEEFDFKKSLWEIPASRMKMKKAHMVPLSKQALAVLKELKVLAGNSPLVLPGKSSAKPISNNSMLFALYRLGYRGRMTGHGFRALASTVLNESNLFNHDWVERQLAHVPENQVAGAYNRALYLAGRTAMMQWWGDHLDEQAGGSMFAPALLKN